jgi:hypothetical protein
MIGFSCTCVDSDPITDKPTCHEPSHPPTHPNRPAAVCRRRLDVEGQAQPPQPRAAGPDLQVGQKISVDRLATRTHHDDVPAQRLALGVAALDERVMDRLGS